MFAASNVAQWAKWIVLVLGVGGLVVVLVVGTISWSDHRRTEQNREQWDVLYKALKPLKDNDRPAERIAALESIAESKKVYGSAAHACALMELGSLYFDEAVDPVKTPEERAAALDKATKLYKTVAANEPYASNAVFGPVAVEGAALSLEQAQDYDAAIALLEEKLPVLEKQSHFLSARAGAQLGRLYWLRYQKKNDPQDRDAAREKLAEVLRSEDRGKWREQAEYIKSLVDKRGKALEEGKAAPPKKEPPKVEPKTGPKKEEAKKDETKKDDTKTEPKKEEAKKDETKKDETKAEPKTETKK